MSPDAGPRAAESGGTTPLLGDLLARARRSPGRIVLAEAADERILEGAMRAARAGLARPILLGDPMTVRARLADLGGGQTDIGIVDPRASPDLAR